MSRFVPTQLDTETIQESSSNFVDWVNGAKEAPGGLLERTSLAELQSAAATALEKMSTSEDVNERMRLSYAVALARDAAYAYASRGELLGVRIRGEIVDLYEYALLSETFPAAAAA